MAHDTQDLFSRDRSIEDGTIHPELRPEGLHLRLHPHAFDPATSARLFASLRDTVPWSQEHLRIYGREVAVPRLTAWYGEPGRVYTYSGIRMEPLPWSPALREVLSRVEALEPEIRWNTALLNLYRDGEDSVAWHQDDEPELGDAPFIASVSFGATRTFRLRTVDRARRRTVDLELADGSLLVMAPPTQTLWEHAIPKRKRVRDARINITFRRVQRPGRTE